MQENLSNKQKVLQLLKNIPYGKITSFGRISNLTGINPRVVGFILSGLTKQEMEKEEIPWHRVVDRNGFISASKLGEKGILQQKLLENEGIEVKEFQIINPEEYWQ